MISVLPLVVPVGSALASSPPLAAATASNSTITAGNKSAVQGQSQHKKLDVAHLVYSTVNHVNVSIGKNITARTDNEGDFNAIKQVHPAPKIFLSPRARAKVPAVASIVVPAPASIQLR